MGSDVRETETDERALFADACRALEKYPEDNGASPTARAVSARERAAFMAGRTSMRRDARDQALVELRGKVVPLLGTKSIAECLAKMRKFPNFTHPELVLMAILDLLLDPSDANGGSDGET